jgi:hypothetical protein
MLTIYNLLRQDICGTGFTNVSLMASPRAVCATSLAEADVVPTSASYSLELRSKEYTPTTNNLNLNIVLNMQKMNTCVFDKGSIMTLLTSVSL